MNQRDKILEVISVINAARSASDTDAIKENLSSEVVLHTPPSLGFSLVEGAQQVAEVLAGTLTKKVLSRPDARRDVHRVIADSECAVVLQRLSGSFGERGFYDNDYVWVYEFTQGKVSRISEYTDTLHAERVGFLTQVLSG